MLAPLAVLLAAIPLPPCAAVPPPAVQFAPGEQLKFRLDLFGGDVGTFDVSLERSPASDQFFDRLAEVSNTITEALRQVGLVRSSRDQEAQGLYALLCGLMPVMLSRHIERIRSWGYQFVTFGELAARAGSCPGGAEGFVALTFDDGLANLRDQLSPILEAHATQIRLVPGSQLRSEAYAKALAAIAKATTERRQP